MTMDTLYEVSPNMSVTDHKSFGRASDTICENNMKVTDNIWRTTRYMTVT